MEKFLAAVVFIFSKTIFVAQLSGKPTMPPPSIIPSLVMATSSRFSPEIGEDEFILDFQHTSVKKLQAPVRVK